MFYIVEFRDDSFYFPFCPITYIRNFINNLLYICENICILSFILKRISLLYYN